MHLQFQSCILGILTVEKTETGDIVVDVYGTRGLKNDLELEYSGIN